jgi:hypothetical protein
LAPGDSEKVWDADQPAAGTGGVSASKQLALVRVPGDTYTAFCVDGFFASAPGAFEVDVQVAAVDADAQYQTIANGNITTVDATNQTFHFDAAGVPSAKFVRLLMRSRTNAVNVTARITR